MGFDLREGVRQSDPLAELQHRMRNTLATTRLIARRSAETSDNLEDYVAHLDGRLAALARVQNVAIRDPLAGINLGLLVADELTAAGLSNSAQVNCEGPKLLLHPRAAEPLALALHELMTNAIKFGALSVRTGRLKIAWCFDEELSAPRRLVFDWIESGIVLIERPRKKRFGTIVLNDMLAHALGASTTITWLPTGLCCRVVLPLTERVVAPVKASG